jgi:hypothetical protein
MCFHLIADLNNDVFSNMRETTLAQTPLVISKSSVRLANNFVRGQLRDKLLSMDQVYTQIYRAILATSQ